MPLVYGLGVWLGCGDVLTVGSKLCVGLDVGKGVTSPLGVEVTVIEGSDGEAEGVCNSNSGSSLGSAVSIVSSSRGDGLVLTLGVFDGALVVLPLALAVDVGDGVVLLLPLGEEEGG